MIILRKVIIIRMVIEAGSKHIINLTNNMEGGRVKCFQVGNKKVGKGMQVKRGTRRQKIVVVLVGVHHNTHNTTHNLATKVDV